MSGQKSHFDEIREFSAKVSSHIILRIPFFQIRSEIKMEKAQFKKNIHFTNEEEIFVAKMISDGADYNKVLQWHLQRFGRPMHKSKFYAHRKRPQKIWPSEFEKQLLEGHLEIGILAKTESMAAMKWTVALLKQLVEQERMRPAFEGFLIFRRPVMAKHKIFRNS